MNDVSQKAIDIIDLNEELMNIKEYYSYWELFHGHLDSSAEQVNSKLCDILEDD